MSDIPLKFKVGDHIRKTTDRNRYGEIIAIDYKSRRYTIQWVTWAGVHGAAYIDSLFELREE